MDMYSRGLGWTSDGKIVEDNNQRPAMIEGSKLLMNIVMFHLLTEPGSYKPSPNLGLGLLRLIGKGNTDTNRSMLEEEINSYFVGLTDLMPYRVRARVTQTGPSSIEIRITLLGPNLAEDNILLLEIKEGRIVNAESFVEQLEALPESIVEVRSVEQENEYLARLSRR